MVKMYMPYDGQRQQGRSCTTKNWNGEPTGLNQRLGFPSLRHILDLCYSSGNYVVAVAMNGHRYLKLKFLYDFSQFCHENTSSRAGINETH